jgi:hypothetical protein
MIEFGVVSLPSVAPRGGGGFADHRVRYMYSAENGPVAHFPEVLLGKSACEILSLRST